MSPHDSERTAPLSTLGNETALRQQTPWSLTGVPMDPPSEGIYVQKPGPWFRNDEGAFAWASLGMLADHGLSLVLLDGHPPGMNGMVTTELSIDFNPAADPSNDEFRLDTHIVGISQVGGLSKGEISNRRGDRVAIASLSGRYLPVPEGGYLELPPAPAETVPFTTMLPMLFEGTSDGTIGTLPIPLWLANPRGIMHGGIHTIALEYTARKTLGEALWRPTSIRVSFLRGIPVDDLLTVVATRVHTGRSLTVVRVESRRTDGKLAGIATVSYEAR